LQHDNTIQEDLVLQARNGDPNARAGLYRLYVKAMYNTCIRITGSKTAAEDALQDAFIYAFEHLGDIKNPAAFGGWLRKIVVGKAIRTGKTAFTWDELDDAHHHRPAEEEPDWWTGISMEAVHEAIKTLPDGCRQVFSLYVFEDFGHKEIADSMGISESTSKSQYQRARKLLRERLTKKIVQHG